MYNIKIKVFEGPLDLLLHLVDKNRLDITEVSLSSILEEYKVYINNLRNLKLEIESSFLTVFASLLEIKSKVLLPKPPIDEENEEEIDEHELVTKLKEYRKLKESAKILKTLKEKTECSLNRPPDKSLENGEPVLTFTSQISGEELLDIYKDLMKRFVNNKNEVTLQLVREKVSLPLILKMISKKIKKETKTGFFDLFDSPPNRLEFIITFLAVLEMARRHEISIVPQEQGGLTILNKKLVSEKKNMVTKVFEKIAG